uniref:ABC-type uncharacterized transport system involved in gliding motility, auxiliary component n=1 Tax=Candidatus Kentrum sp. DK TaxID=2126562 RepID=A0A450T9F9_9GAMM|nr:MAG: ABC-type uncharacterized transport system involved in gliding motility, auxiliary component [Candidatus Kentron sp. DK]
MENIMKVKWLAGSGLLLAVILLFTVNIFSEAAFRSLRLDLTEGQRYTLSEGTRSILSELEEPVTLRLFLSQKQVARLPGISGYATRVRELLEEYRRISGGMVRVRLIDPEPFSEEEDRALDYGLSAAPWNNEGDSFYFGLVGSGPTDTEILIPFFSPDRKAFIEYDLTNLIYQLTHPDRKVVGLMNSLAIRGGEGAATDQRAPGQDETAVFGAIMAEIRRYFDLRMLATDSEQIPDDVDVLMLVHPRELPENTLYAIDQFVLRGGHALVFVDPYTEPDPADNATATTTPGIGVTRSHLDPLFAAWGIGFSTGKVIGDIRLAESVRFDTDSISTTTDYPIWIRLPHSQMDKGDVITVGLDTVFLASPGRLWKIPEGKTRFHPLLRTTTNAFAFDTTRIMLLADPRALLRGYRESGEEYTLAARVTGQVGSAFPKGPPTDSGGKKPDTGDAGDTVPPRGHRSTSEGDINIIVVADTDILRDRFWIGVQDFQGTRVAQPTAANGTFVINAIENLTGSSDLTRIRSRGNFNRPFTRVDTLRERAEFHFLRKEKELTDKLRETEHRLVELERGERGGNGAWVLSEAQQWEIDRFREEKLRIRKELRRVRHGLRKNIQRMENRLKFINIGLVPLLIGLGGIVFAGYRARGKRPRKVPENHPEQAPPVKA